jgi:hypothetical protein
MNTRLVDFLKGIGGQHEASTGKSRLRLTLKQVHSLFGSGDAVEALTGAFSTGRSGEYNAEQLGEYSLYRSRRDDVEFAGGTYAELQHGLTHGADLTACREARAKFANGQVAKQLRATIQGLKPKRTLRMSDCEGDWQYDLRYDDRPYVESRLEKRPARVIELYAYFNFSCAVDAEKITEYGTYVWGLSDLIESAGVQTRIIWANECSDAYGDSRTCHSQLTEIEVKRPGEYITPGMLAAVFTSNFYRRYGFALKVLDCEAVGTRIGFGYGCPKHRAKFIEFSDGRISLTGDVMRGSTDEVINALTAAFGRKGK